MFTIEKTNKCSVEESSLEEAKVLEKIFQSKAKYRKIIQAGIAQWVKDFQQGRIRIESVEDLKKLIEIDVELAKEELFLRSRNSRQQRR
ncbi:hypothetical protein [Desulforamulus aquiferis]|uniref:Uncharacterized protein n=1 Tax=Desulforamulus aquiferis TaxID=1397668 RepID=A0AAW7ZEB2_9FIRM|nr:hypothetical protein [Desulforamulus aquiferis]MDO7787140.1 hypothetical protein [Desulforamulus aquiferis]